MQLNWYYLVHHVENSDLGKVQLPETPRQGNGIVVEHITNGIMNKRDFVVLGTRYIVSPSGSVKIETRVLPEGYKMLAKKPDLQI